MEVGCSLHLESLIPDYAQGVSPLGRDITWTLAAAPKELGSWDSITSGSSLNRCRGQMAEGISP
jgi:hypothetical protein